MISWPNRLIQLFIKLFVEGSCQLAANFYYCQPSKENNNIPSIEKKKKHIRYCTLSIITINRIEHSKRLFFLPNLCNIKTIMTFTLPKYFRNGHKKKLLSGYKRQYIGFHWDDNNVCVHNGDKCVMPLSVVT